MAKIPVKSWKKKAAYILISVLLLCFIAGEIAKPRQITEARLRGLAIKIAEYMNAHASIPISLSELPKRKGYDNRIRDGWFRKIEFVEQENGFFMLRSYGRDGKPGGMGGNTDITLTFEVSNGKIEYDTLKIEGGIR